MTTENLQDANTAASNKQEAVENEGPFTWDEVVQLRTKQRAERIAPPPVVEPEPEEAPETEDEPDVSEEEPEPAEQDGIAEEEESPKSDDVLSKFDLESMSEEELAELGKAVKSKVPKRFGELTKRAKAAEEELQRLRAKLNEKPADNPLEKKAPIENNPFKDIATIEALVDQNAQFERVIEWADELLDEHEDASFDDYITEQDGKQMTKREVKQYLKKARKAKDTFLPARLAEIRQEEHGKQIQAALDDKAKAELPWYSDTDEETYREFRAVVDDPRIKIIRERVPEVAPQLDYLLAHAVNSMAQTLNKAKAVPKKAAPRPTPPSNPAEGVARSTDRSAEVSKDLKAVQQRFEESRSIEDFIALRTKQRLRKNR